MAETEKKFLDLAGAKKLKDGIEQRVKDGTWVAGKVKASGIEGVIALENLPKGALERMLVVADDTALLALTDEQVQQGDTVKVESTGLMYYVVDDSKLGTEGAFEPYSAGKAAQADADGDGNNIKTTYATKTELDDKVDKEAGKGLSTNDFTTELKQKLEGLVAAAEGGSVTSVNGKTGAVVIGMDDIDGLQEAIDSKLDASAMTPITAEEIESIFSE